MATTSDSTAILQELLQNLNRVWNKDPRQRFILRVAYSGTTGKFSIRNGEFFSEGLSNPAEEVRIALEGLTVGQFATALGLLPGWSVSTPPAPSDASKAAILLLDVDAQDLFDPASLGHGGDVFGHSTTLWDMAKAWARQLKIAGDDMDNALAQMNFLTSEKPWVDYWGSTFYNVARVAGEADAKYARRTIHEIVALKCNRYAIQQFLIDILEVPADNIQVDDSPLFLLNDWNHSLMFGPTEFWTEEVEPGEVNHRRMLFPFAGIQYGCFFVWILTDDDEGLFYTSSEIDAIVHRIKAAGTCFHIIFRSTTEEVYDHRTRILEEVVDTEPIDEGLVYVRGWFTMLAADGSGSDLGDFDKVMIYAHAMEEVL